MNPKTFALLFGCMFLIGSAEVATGPIMIHIGRHFGVAPEKAAYLPASYGLTYALIALVTGPLSDRFGRKLPLGASLVAFAMACWLIPFTRDFGAALTLSGCMGVCAAVIQPNALSVIGDEIQGSGAGKYFGRVLVGLMSAFVITPALSGWLAGLLGWQACYFLMGTLACVLAVSVPALLRSRPRGLAKGSLASGYLSALRIRTIGSRFAASYLWLGYCAGFGAIVANVALGKLAITAGWAGLLAGFYGMVVIAGNASSGWVQQLLGQRALLAMSSLAALGILLFALPIPSVWHAAAAGIPWAFGYGCGGPIHHSRLSGLSERYRGTINSYQASLLNLGIFSVSSWMALIAGPMGIPAFCCVIGSFALTGTLFLLKSK